MENAKEEKDVGKELQLDHISFDCLCTVMRQVRCKCEVCVL